MDKTESVATHAAKPAVTASQFEAHSVEPQYRTTFFFVMTMLTGIIVGWVVLLGLLLRRY